MCKEAAGGGVALSPASWLCLPAQLFVGLALSGDLSMLSRPRLHQNINGGDEDKKENQNDVWCLVTTLILNCLDSNSLSSMSTSACHVPELIQSPHLKVSSLSHQGERWCPQVPMAGGAEPALVPRCVSSLLRRVPRSRGRGVVFLVLGWRAGCSELLHSFEGTLR